MRLFRRITCALLGHGPLVYESWTRLPDGTQRHRIECCHCDKVLTEASWLDAARQPVRK